jgi:hypothetical protein
LITCDDTDTIFLSDAFGSLFPEKAHPLKESDIWYVVYMDGKNMPQIEECLPERFRQSTMSPRCFGWYNNRTLFSERLNKTIQAIRVTARTSINEDRRVTCTVLSGGVGYKEVEMRLSGSGMRSDWEYSVELYVQQ